jgi:uncharacterized protein YqjF (DUF2071 family)
VTADAITTTCPGPVERPIMLQGWYDLASIHWPYDPADVQRLLPEDFRVDTCDGAAWVGLIPFHMRRIRLPGCPPFGRWSTFPETNVRTYVVTPDGRRAVWFCSLDISRLVPAVVARLTYGLPYCWGSMSITRDGIDTVQYTASRRWPHRGARSRLEIRIGDAVRAADLTELERFVTARWTLASELAGVGLGADVDHPPWVLHRSTLIECDDTFITTAGLPAPTGEPIVLWSPGVEVRVGRPRRITPGRGHGTPR